MISPVIKAFGLLKKACAMNNKEFGIEDEISEAIVQACDEMIAGNLNNQIPLNMWEQVSGSKTNANVNEAIATRANEILGGVMGIKTFVHPIDHVNKNQRSDHLFSSVMNIAAIGQLNLHLHPPLKHLQEVFKKKSKDFSSTSTLGQTAPTTLSQNFSGYAHQISMNIERLKTCQSSLCQLAIDDAAVGTEVNTPKAFGESVAQCLTGLTDVTFINVPNKFEESNTYNRMVELSGALNTLSVSLMKIANDIRLLDSRSRYGELILSENQPGSSIMLDKVNSTQCEAMNMVAAQVMINHVAVTVGVSMGNFELNIFKPIIIKNILHTIQTVGDACHYFNEHLLVEPNAGISNMESPLINMIQMVNNLETSSSYSTSNNNRSKRAKLHGSRQSKKRSNVEYISRRSDFIPPPPVQQQHLQQQQHPQQQQQHLQQQQHPQQQQIEEQIIKNLAEELKTYPPRH